MIPSAFGYHRATSVDDALSAISAADGGAKQGENGNHDDSHQHENKCVLDQTLTLFTRHEQHDDDSLYMNRRDST